MHGSKRNKGQDINSGTLLEFRTPSGRRVIPSISELAFAVHRQAGSGYREARTMVPFLSDVLRGRRRASEEVLESIRSFVAESLALEPPSVRKSLLPEFEARLKELAGAEDFVPFACARADALLLIRAVKNASTAVAVLPSGVFANEAGRFVMELFASRSGLLSRDRSSEQLRVQLWFKDEISVRQWWWLLQAFLDQIEPDVLKQQHVAKLIRACDTGDIQTFIVDAMATGVKVIITDPDVADRTSAFTFNFSHRDESVYLQSLGPDGAKEWLENVFGPVSITKKPVMAKDVFPDISV